MSSEAYWMGNGAGGIQPLALSGSSHGSGRNSNTVQKSSRASRRSAQENIRPPEVAKSGRSGAKYKLKTHGLRARKSRRAIKRLTEIHSRLLLDTQTKLTRLEHKLAKIDLDVPDGYRNHQRYRENREWDKERLISRIEKQFKTYDTLLLLADELRQLKHRKSLAHNVVENLTNRMEKIQEMTNNYLENSMPESEIRKYSLFSSSRDIGTNSLEPYKRPFEEEIQNPFRQSNSAPRTGSPRAPVPDPPSSGEYNPFRSSFTARHLQRQDDAIEDSSDVHTNGWKNSLATLDEKTIDECMDELFGPFQCWTKGGVDSRGEIAIYHDQKVPTDQEALPHLVSQMPDEVSVDWNSDRSRLLQLELRHMLRSLNGLEKLHFDAQNDLILETDSDDDCISDTEATKIRPQTWGRQRLEEWKANAGKSKDWRIYPLLKISTKRKEQSCTTRKLNLRKSTLEPLSWNRSSRLPVNALKSCNTRLRKDLKPGTKSSKYFQLYTKRVEHEKAKLLAIPMADLTETSYGNDHDNVEREKRTNHPTFSSWLTEANDIRSQWHTARSLRKAAGLDQHDWPLSLHRSGELLRYPYRLMKHLRTEPHGEVYVLEDLDSGISYEAKIYILRGIHPSQRKRRVDNLKRMTALPSFILSFDYGGKKYCLFEPTEPEVTTPPAKLGAIGRRNTSEYRTAFPELLMPEAVRLERQAALRLKLSATWKDAVSDATTRQLLYEIGVELLQESKANGKKWQNFSSPLPPVLRVLVQLGEHDSAWNIRANALLRQTLLLHLGSMPLDEGTKIRRKKKATKVAKCNV